MKEYSKVHRNAYITENNAVMNYSFKLWTHDILKTGFMIPIIWKEHCCYFLYARMQLKLSPLSFLNHISMGKTQCFPFGWWSVVMAWEENNSLAMSHMVIKWDSGSADLITWVFSGLILNDTEKSIMRTAKIIIKSVDSVI